MTPQARRVVLAVLAVLGLLLARRRPVRGPEPAGDWHPAGQ
jgi:hypothetical protein